MEDFTMTMDLPAMIDFGREACGRSQICSQREWLVTNGIGGYASGTLGGALTRRYHGLLVAALQPPLGRTLLVTKVDETARYLGETYPLFRNHWANVPIEPQGDRYLERFHLAGTIPVWTFALADARLEKRVWMQPGANTTYLQYRLTRASGPLDVAIKVLVNYRGHHGSTRAGGLVLEIEERDHGLEIQPPNGPAPFYLLSPGASIQGTGQWYRGYYLEMEAYRGLEAREDHYYAGVVKASLAVGQALTLVASTSPHASLDGVAALKDRTEYEQHLLERGRQTGDPAWMDQLILAADQFIVRRQGAEDLPGSSILAGYPWFSDWGRDTMISLPGLTLATGRPEVARRILHTFADAVDEGMLPNRFPEEGHAPEYNTVDATLWYFDALRAYHEVTGDDDLLVELLPVLEDIVAWHRRGTRFQIQADPQDGLLYAGEPGVQLTWMDARVEDWVVTPRMGKPVEVNALWYNALRILVDLARKVGRPISGYDRLAKQVQMGFQRFWNPDLDCCYDVVDGPDGQDATLRPNQLLAVSLAYSPLSPSQQRAVVQVCARRLWTSLGLRSLDPSHPDYAGHYGGDPRQRDGAYHQGTVWAWLMGPFVSAHFRVYRDPAQARSFLEPFVHHLKDHGVGTISEIFDGEPPHTPRGCYAQAWSVAEILRVWRQTATLD